MDLFFAISKVAVSLLLPGNLIVVLMLCAAGLALSPRTRVWGVRMGTVAASLLLAGALLPIGPLLLGALERRFPQLDRCYTEATQPIAGIILLGGGVSSASIDGKIVDNLNEASDRVRLASTLARRYPDAPLVVSGGQASDTGFERPEADAMRDFLEELGVAGKQIVLERDSRTTAENATLTTPKTTDGDWLLVTSAFHMPRAIGTFRKAGLSVIAAPTDWRTTDTLSLQPFDAVSNLAMLNMAAKEYLGLLGYWVTGRTSELLPGANVTDCSQSARARAASARSSLERKHPVGTLVIKV